MYGKQRLTGVFTVSISTAGSSHPFLELCVKQQFHFLPLKHPYSEWNFILIQDTKFKVLTLDKAQHKHTKENEHTRHG